MKKPAILLFLVLFTTAAGAQTSSLDSLRHYYHTEKNSQTRVITAIEICSQSYSLSQDTLLKYITEAQKLVPEKSEYSYRISNYYSYYLIKSGKPKAASACSDSLLNSLPDEFRNSKVETEILNAKATALIRDNQNKTATEISFELLSKSEQLKDTLMIMRAYNLLGWSKMEMEQDYDAIGWFKKGIAFTQNEALWIKANSLFLNTASCYNNLHMPDSSEKYMNIGMRYSILNENLTSQANAHNIKASMLLTKNNLKAAESELNEGLKLREQIGDPFYLISDLAQLSMFYAGSGQAEKGIATANRGIILAREIRNIPKLLFLYAALGENYKAAGRQEEYAKTLIDLINLKDSLYAENSAEQLAEIQAKYEIQKKENIILQQKFELERNQYYLIGSIVLFILSSVVVFLIYKYRNLKEKEKIERMLIEQKIISRQEVQKAQENERKRIAADLHDNLGSYAAAISSNAKSIKDGVSKQEIIIEQLEENAQNIVTQLSDTIWILKNEQLPFTSLCDRFKTWMQRLMRNYPNVHYDFNESISVDLVFSPAKMLHLFLIMKECVNNALKHSGADEIRIRFACEKEFKIEITDNGQGFDFTGPRTGSGIENILYRIKECGWKIEWQKNEKSGTTIYISGDTTN